MPDRIIKESLCASPNLSKCSLLAQGHFLRLLTQPDDFGCFESDADIIQGKCWPRNKDEATIEKIEAWHDELVSNNLIARWYVDGHEYSVFIKWSKHQRIRSLHKRKTPPPPSSIVVNCQQLTSIDVLNPNPNPNPNPNHETPYSPPFEKGDAAGDSFKKPRKKLRGDKKMLDDWYPYECVKCGTVRYLKEAPGPDPENQTVVGPCLICKGDSIFKPSTFEEIEGDYDEETAAADVSE